MPNPDPDILRTVNRWIKLADDDLCIASDALKYGSRKPYHLIAYHAQQCAEKCLKGYLVCHGEDFPYTHNIRRLLQLCEKHAKWPQDLKNAEELTPYAITTRYPGEDMEVTEGEANKAIEIARRVRNRVRTELKQLGVDIQE